MDLKKILIGGSILPSLQAIFAREAKRSTGTGIHRTGTDFAAMDGEPSTIFIASLYPENRAGPHIQFLTEISKVLSCPELREKLLNAATADDRLNLLTN
jgi:mannitol/fructose-specific phosphotransferase system IIA component (Ntr-type)